MNTQLYDSALLPIRLKSVPEHFQVIEDMQVSLNNAGEHLWLWIEKRLLTTDIVRSILAKAFNVNIRDIQYAGKKDKHAVTQQWFSLRLPGTATTVQLSAPQVVAKFLTQSPLYEGESLVVLQAQVHQKKCQTGCHNGNFFRVQAVLEAGSGDHISQSKLDASARSIMALGTVNLFGEQRFLGIQSLTDLDAALTAMPKKINPTRLKPKQAWTCSQVRSFLFNQLVQVRKSQLQLWCRPQVGDVVQLVGSKSVFIVTEDDDLPNIVARAKQHDIVVTGPLFGAGGVTPSAKIAELEQSVLEQLSPDGIKVLLKLQTSSRRALIVKPKEFKVRLERNDSNSSLHFEFWLPVGSYATVCIEDFVSNYLVSEVSGA